ncbi:MAG: hypothetical protein UU14_C0031G0005 [Candidatus Roizmanbacteria bacterium GW2011_GWB1_40_7]|uniref:Uncharacterized protein n=1 Tax=Candidatus Roizmanbacteria bacterium GW2011_GWB1_40_7 TaxID=1618482 RepID=A0A0G0T2M4_9BACT|nr:MAG: hypothetical protein US43_C0018G0015 [Candidatus Levybacteria bacterium GW2011_GWA1_37_16]KKR71293.1 MAG: hypothetical protein UU14_C0031G0005 [Candidatus Roizmanbacteria bacterium GW2011_GWB1_40_7]OGH51188.1 MAG: hypothetical protein A3H17_03010 [Candidatus Levybacteria bacterium RIFCSPLOWO2_12_FULL_37_14]
MSKSVKKSLTKKSFVIILVLSVIATYGAAFVDDSINLAKNPTGLPFGFASFNFLGASNNNLMLTLDIIFWFIVIWVIWKALLRLFKKR